MFVFATIKSASKPNNKKSVRSTSHDSMDIPDTPTDNNGLPSSDAKPNKRRRKKSIVWDHFTVQTAGAGCMRAYCKGCKKSYAYITGSKVAGTSHLKRHIALGICPVSCQVNQIVPVTPGSKIDFPKERYQATLGYESFQFDQNCFNRGIAKMIILHEYPLHFVEQSGFINFIQSLQPKFSMPGLKTIQGDCMAMYLEEKRTLLNLVNAIPGRVSLAMDLRVSNQTVGYVSLTGHFIDGNWNLHRQILNVVRVPSPDSDDAISQAIAASLSDWHLECKLFSLTLDTFVLSDRTIENIRGYLPAKNQHMLNGQLVIGNCFARVLSRLAQGALDAMRETIDKIRDNIKYVKTSESHEEMFIELKEQLQVPSMKDLLIDDRTKWDTTYHMLVTACELKEVFACLDTSDLDYKIMPTIDEWKQVEILCTYLKLFLDVANILIASTYPTANAFFCEVSKIQFDLMQTATSEDPFISYMTKPLHEKFDAYWRSCCLVLSIAVVMDPRFKMEFVKLTFFKMYGDNAESWISIVDDGIHELFIEYTTQMLTLPDRMMEEGNEGIMKTNTSHEESHDGPLISVGEGISDFEIFISDISSSQQFISELDQYLEDSLHPHVQEFDVLGWWKLNRDKYPLLSKMACDILSIPVSTIGPESVFDTEIKKISSYHCSLPPMTLEALICAKDWLRYGSSTQTPSLPFEVSNAIVKMEF